MEISVTEFKGLTDLPAYNREPGYLRTLKNLRPRPGGYLEMRGGLERMKPSGGTPSNPVSLTYGYLGAIDLTTPWGWVRARDNAGLYGGGIGYSENMATTTYFYPFTSAPALGTAFYVGSDQPFSSVTITLGRAANWGATTLVYEYGTTDGSPSLYTALTTTTTFDMTTAIAAGGVGRATTASWAMPSNWVPTTEGDAGERVRKYWMRVRISVFGALVTSPTCAHENVKSDWTGGHEFLVATGDPVSGSNNSVVYRASQNVTALEWSLYSAATGFSGNSARQRMASYRGVLYYVNGRDQIRTAGRSPENMGLPAPTSTIAVAQNAAVLGTTWTAGASASLRFRYAITWGYGSQQIAVPRDRIDPVTAAAVATDSSVWAPTLFGESQPIDPASVTYAGGATPYVQVNDAQAVDIVITGAPTIQSVNAIYIYRTNDLTNVPVTAIESMPYFFIAAIYVPAGNGGVGSFGTPYTIRDQTLAFPGPIKELDQEDALPPTHCKLIWFSKNRAFLANSDRYPARVWWSDPYVPDRYNQDLNFEDFSTNQGGRVTAGTEFHNMSVVFTEDQMYGIADVDVDQFQSFPVAPGVGCIAPDAVCTGDGLLIWPARDGFYIWSGEGLPVKISKVMDDTFGKLSFELHGGSRGTFHNHQYEIWFMSPAGVVGRGFRYDLLTHQWYELEWGISHKVVPLCTATMPLGHQDYGVRHPVYAQTPVGATTANIYVGEMTTQDDGSAITATADIHFGPFGYKMLKPDRFGYYYQAADGWGTPALSYATTSAIGTDLTALGSGTPDTGADYSLIQGTAKERATGSQDIVGRFTVASTSGTLWRQRLLAAFLVGEDTEPRRP